jgi:peptide/nickel transport system substrate-binding protein
MRLRNASPFRPMIAVLAITTMVVALACAGDDATPTSPPTATSPVPTATSPASSTTSVPEATEESSGNYVDLLLEDPGYKSEWGTPKQGGTLKTGLPVPISRFTPNTSDVYSGMIIKNVYNSLIRFNPWEGIDSIVPDLAESWNISNDGLTITMRLQKGVKFQDNPSVPEEYNGGRIWGDEFVCEDAKASVERYVFPPESEKSQMSNRALLSNVTGVSCPDGAREYTLVIERDIVRGVNMRALANGHVVMFDKDYVEWLHAEEPGSLTVGTTEAFKMNLGTGPWVPMEFAPDVVAKTRRNSDYWREGLPLLDASEYHIIRDYTAKFTALVTGKIHVLGAGSTNLLQGQIAQAQRDFADKIVLHKALGGGGYGSTFNLARAPFDDKRVRWAINLGLSRGDWLTFNKAGDSNRHQLMGILAPNQYWSHSKEELKTWPGIREPDDQDVAEANRLLDEVLGEGNRLTLECMSRNTQTYMDVCNFIGDQLKRNLGIDVNMNFAESAVTTQLLSNCSYDLTGRWTMPSTSTVDPDERLFSAFVAEYISATNQCTTVGVDPAVQAQIEEDIRVQSIEADPIKRRELTRILERKLFEESRYIMLGWLVYHYATVPQVKGYFLYDYFPYSNWPLYERLWLSE